MALTLARLIRVLDTSYMVKAILRIVLVLGAAGCFVASWRYFDAGVMYVAETSSNPHPSEVARVMGPRVMGYFKLYFWSGVACVVALALSFIRKSRRV